ncbi:MAG: F0F1 ATP synthase subunit gamma [Pseudomonadota bacterium]|nr:F0F1 ATP synthase subunit gamma [Pseudomonadota bacterium]
MASLKDLKLRITSVQSTRKITSAMKMVAASKLRRAQNLVEEARPYADRMSDIMQKISLSIDPASSNLQMLSGNGSDDTHLVLVMTANRGLCGGFNSNIIRSARQMINDLISKQKKVKIFTIGRKGKEALKQEYGHLFEEHYEDFGRKGVSFTDAEKIASIVIKLFDNSEFDVCHLIYAKFISAMTQEVTRHQAIPYNTDDLKDISNANNSSYEYEPSEQEILESLLPRNLAVQIFRSLLENGASEQGARMTAMDNATRNAGEMIDKLTLKYNRTRQAQITTELIEIISGAEAV